MTTRAIGRADAADCIPTACASRMFSDQNPMMQPVKALAEAVRADAQAGRAGQSAARAWSRSPRPGSRPGWRATGSARDAMTEAMFLGAYGSPLLQAHGRAGHRACADASGASSATCCARPTTAQHAGRARDALRGRAACRGGAPRPDLRPAAGAQRRRARLRRPAGDPRHAAGQRPHAASAELKALSRRNSICCSAWTRSAPCAPSRACCPTSERRTPDRARRRAAACSARAARLPEEGLRPPGADRSAVRRVEAEAPADEGDGQCLTAARRAADAARQVRAPDRARPASIRRWRPRSPIPATRFRWRAPSRRRGSG